MSAPPLSMPRFRHVLVARDFSPCSERALEWGLDLARRTGATLHLLYAEVLHADPFVERAGRAAPVEAVRERLRQQADGRPLDEQVDPERVEIREVVVRDVAAAPALVRYAEEHDIDLIVMGTHGRRGVRRLLLGSVTSEVIRAAPCSVLAVRANTPAGRVGSVLVPVDFSEPSRRALHEGRAAAAFFGTRLDVAHVVEAPAYPSFYDADVVSLYELPPRFVEEAERQLRRFYEQAEGPAPPDVSFGVMVGQPFRRIAGYAEEHQTGLIVMGTRGLTGLQHYLLGSTAERTLRLAPCPVLVVKGEEAAGDAATGRPAEAA